MRQSKLAQDKIYGLLGLLQHAHRATEHLLSNHDWSFAAVYAIYAAAFAKESRMLTTPTHNPALKLLCNASCCIERLDGHPFWVPNWSTAASRVALGRITKRISLSKTEMFYDASGWQNQITRNDRNQIPLQ